MEKLKAKHDHKLTDILKVLIFTLFLILPIMTFLPSCLYYGCNKYATDGQTTTINYKYQSNEVNSLDDLVVGNIYECDKLMFADDLTPTYTAFTINVHYIGGIGLQATDSTYVELTSIQELNTTLACYDNDYGEGFYYLNLYLDYEIENSSIGQWFYYLQTYHIIFSFESDYEITQFKKFFNDTLLIYNDNEITLPHYTNYNVIESVDVQDTSSDIMSVFMDDFNNAVDKYFNMGNVFNMNDVYLWFNTNIFNGHAPVIMSTIWNIVLYEFLMDLIFLLYSLFMFFIDCCTNLIDRFHSQCSGR